MEFLSKPWAGEFPLDKPEPRCCGETMEFVTFTDTSSKEAEDVYWCVHCNREEA